MYTWQTEILTGTGNRSHVFQPR